MWNVIITVCKIWCLLYSITVKFNISRSVQSVDSEVDDVEHENPGVELKSTPDFDIDIKRGDTTLGFNCSFIQDEEAEGK